MYEVVAGAKGRRLFGFSITACHSTHGFASHREMLPIIWHKMHVATQAATHPQSLIGAVC